MSKYFMALIFISSLAQARMSKKEYLDKAAERFDKAEQKRITLKPYQDKFKAEMRAMREIQRQKLDVIKDKLNQ